MGRRRDHVLQDVREGGLPHRDYRRDSHELLHGAHFPDVSWELCT